MTKFLFGVAFSIGIVAIFWIGRIFLGADALGLGVTVLIGAVYIVGTMELIWFRRATSSLKSALEALEQPAEQFSTWLADIDAGLQTSVRLRVQGERIGLPAPVLTPYLVGLLVMLGLLGTFVGMVSTLKGAVLALEGSNELEAIRAGLAAPIEGLGLAFGTSVAGVAASAMLGLLLTISRRERLQVSQLLDHKTGTDLSQFSLAHQQTRAFKAIVDQAQALPEVVENLSNLVTHLELSTTKTHERLLENQQQFQDTVTKLYGELNESVDESLKTTLVQTATKISAEIQPLTSTALEHMNESVVSTQKQLADVTEQQVSAFLQTVSDSNATMLATAKTVSANQEASNQRIIEGVNEAMSDANKDLNQRAEAMLSSFERAGSAWMAEQQTQSERLTATLNQHLQQLRDEEAQRGAAAVARLAGLETKAAEQLGLLGTALEEPMLKLIETASQTPKAAAEVITKLRDQMSNNLERDNELLQERANLMTQLESLSESLEQGSKGQQATLDALLERSGDTLMMVSQQFSEQVGQESAKLAQVSEHFANSSAEIASLGDVFGAAVTLFGESNQQLIENLTRIEASLEHSNSRSDEQLAYYVAQAREIIDHNVLSHQQIIASLEPQRGKVKDPKQLSVNEATG